MCEVVLLFEGYSTQIDDVTMDANCSCTFIRARNEYIIVDTMTAWDSQNIIEALDNIEVIPTEINYVVCSHSHADHVGNNNLFTKAKEHIVGTTVHQKTLFLDRNIKNSDYHLCEDVKVIATPGHTAEDVTVMVEGEFKDIECTIAITGDLFEKEEDIQDPTIWMKLGSPDLKEVQALSRCKVAAAADVIIPGHGPAFHVTDEIRNQLAKQLEQIKAKQL